MLQCTLCMHVAAINPTVAMPTHVQTAKSDPERERERERESPAFMHSPSQF